MDNLVVAICWHVYYPISFLKIQKPSSVGGRCDKLQITDPTYSFCQVICKMLRLIFFKLKITVLKEQGTSLYTEILISSAHSILYKRQENVQHNINSLLTLLSHFHI